MRCVSRITFLLFLFIASQVSGITKVSTGNGNWTTNGTWSPSGAPGCGDSVIVQEGHVVTVNSTVERASCGSPMVVVVRGTLHFGGGKKLRLSCNSRIYIFSGGSVDPSGGGSSNTIEICGTALWEAGMGTLSGPNCLPSTLPGCAKVLPVEFTYFDVSPCTPDLCFAWQTGSERNCSHFAVEVLSNDLWKEIGRVNSLAPGGYSRMPLDYSFRLVAPRAGTGYYRLKQVDLSGGERVHRVITAEGFEPAGFSVYPNPARGSCEVRLDASMSGAVVTINDQYGRTWIRVPVPESSQHVSLDLEKLTPGVYFVVVDMGGRTLVRKLVKHSS